METTELGEYGGKLGGWLIFFAINLIIIPMLLIYDVLSGRSTLHSIYLSLPGDFQSYFKLAIAFDLLGSLLILPLAYLFFRRKRATRAYAIIYLLALLVGQFCLYYSLTRLYQKYAIKGVPPTSNSLVTAACIVWPGYWVFSKRVKTTFTQ